MRLDELAQIKLSVTHPGGHGINGDDGDDIMLIGQKNIGTNGEFIIGEHQKYVNDDIDHLVLLEKGDIVMIADGKQERIGDFIVFNYNFRAAAGTHLYVIKSEVLAVPEALRKNRFFLKANAEELQHGRFRLSREILGSVEV